MSEAGDIKTFVVLDLETNGLPSQQFNTCAITELSVYAFSAKCLTDKDTVDTKEVLKDLTPEEGVEGFDQQPPELPRVLNKITLMINPMRMINPIAERETGLSNDMLEHESPFDLRTAECFNLFLERLEKPICMVAHNGWTFDYPIIRYVYDKINKSLPASIFCVDSLKAFRELDEKHEKIKETKKNSSILEAKDKEIVESEPVTNKELEVLNTITSDPLEENSQINWQRDNETTPQRKKKAEKRTYNTSTENGNATDTLQDSDSPAKKRSVSLCVRRSLFADNFTPKTKYPPKGVYQLGNIYKRCFNKEPINLHRAESDVEILSKLILHYGLDFLAYAEERKQLFSQVPKLGSSN
ncbi:uncharacterized protein LOC119602318 [Lucilia sericata]|uniref:uncharacterized protein LOC119602318 n=1 Tax=Lucilia sericata TaxID=13632 RepID=UPI0018A82DCE|nr:uncharacterized protein LOC119602318 [Lucilia sericata]